MSASVLSSKVKAEAAASKAHVGANESKLLHHRPPPPPITKKRREFHDMVKGVFGEQAVECVLRNCESKDIIRKAKAHFKKHPPQRALNLSLHWGILPEVWSIYEKSENKEALATFCGLLCEEEIKEYVKKLIGPQLGWKEMMWIYVTVVMQEVWFLNLLWIIIFCLAFYFLDLRGFKLLFAYAPPGKLMLCRCVQQER
ncbi:hypothetical protein DFH27DRAFT_645113 [Peziza echinospora]|nr:hypothetical protein DFH27DRAFT_645113 [Peziza echinospora]